MKNLLWALIFTALSILIPFLAWSEYRKVSTIYDVGQDGSLTIEVQKGAHKSRRGSKTFYYAGSLDGTPVSIATSQVLSTGVPYRVIYLPEKLEGYTMEGGASFYDYLLGNKGESKWDLFVRKVRFDFLLVGVGVEILWVVFAVLFFRSLLKREE